MRLRDSIRFSVAYFFILVLSFSLIQVYAGRVIIRRLYNDATHTIEIIQTGFVSDNIIKFGIWKILFIKGCSASKREIHTNVISVAIHFHDTYNYMNEDEPR